MTRQPAGWVTRSVSGITSPTVMAHRPRSTLRTLLRRNVVCALTPLTTVSIKAMTIKLINHLVFKLFIKVSCVHALQRSSR